MNMSNNILVALNPRKAVAGEPIKVTIVIRHHMDHGLNLDAFGQMSLPDYIDHVEVLLDGERINEFKTEGSISSDPILGFYIIAPESDGELTVRYRDLAGERGEASFPISVG